MSTTIESLELEIQSNSKSAVSGIDALTQSLTKLKSATKGGLGLGSISKQLRDIGSATSTIDSSSTSNLTGLAKAIQLLGGTKISSSISKQITAISTSLQSADFGSGKAKMEELVDTLSPLASLSKTNLSSYVTNIKKLPEVFAELNKIDMAAFSSKIQAVATAMKPLADEMQKVANGFAAFPNKIQKFLNSTNQVPSVNNKTSVSFTDIYYKMRMIGNTIANVGKKIWSAIEKSADYTENMNLFSVAMGEYAGEAMKYAETVSEAVGIDTSDWIRSQGIFMTMATGFGVASDRAAVMSKNLTQLGYDLSSFYNIDVETAMLKLKSGLAGELEPLRAIGYDLSQAKLEATALELGIDKSVSAMTQAEKAQLRYYAIMTQVTAVQGDMARTLDDPANQLRVLTAQVNMAAREIGNIFIPALNAILPYAIAVVKVIRILAENIASLFGYEMPEVDYSGVNAMGNSAEDTSAALEDATESAKKLKSYMLGFDELNVINPNTDSASGADDPLGEFDFKLPEYDFLAGLAESKINTIVEEMKEWLGLTDDIDSWSELFDTKLGDILETVGLIALGIAAWKVTKTTLDAIDTIKSLSLKPSYVITIGVILTITGIVLSFKGMKEAIENGLDGFNFAEIVGGALLTTGGAGLLGSKIAAWIATTFASSKIAKALTAAASKLGYGTATVLGGAVVAGIAGIVVGIGMMFVGIYDAITEGLDWLSGILTAGGATLIGAGIGAFFGPMGILIGAAIGLVVGLITDLVIWIVQEWDAVSAWFGKVGEWFNTNVIIPVANFFKGLWETVSGFFSNLWDDIVAIWDKVGTWFSENVITPTVDFFKGLWESVSGFFSNLWEDIKGVWTLVSTWFDENVIQPIVDFFAPIVNLISDFFEGCWIIIQAVWLIASTWFDENVIQPIVGFFKGLYEDVSEFFVNLWNDIVIVWTTASTWFNDFVIIPVVEFFKGLWEDVSGFFTQLWTDITLLWKDVSTWFNETVVTPVVDFFKGVWTSVSGFFSSLWEDIKEVWKDVCTWFDDTIITPVKTAFEKACDAIEGFFTSLWLSIRQGVANAMNGVIGGIESAINWVIRGINSLMDGFNSVVEWAADIIGEDWGGITVLQEVSFSRIAVPTYATGGFPEQGQMFIANEAGAEMVGNIGRRTAVANNDQIVSGIAGGVAEANEEQNALLREQNSLLRAILEKDSGVYLDGKNLTNSVEKYQRERGRVLVTGGVI